MQPNVYNLYIAVILAFVYSQLLKFSHWTLQGLLVTQEQAEFIYETFKAALQNKTLHCLKVMRTKLSRVQLQFRVQP